MCVHEEDGNKEKREKGARNGARGRGRRREREASQGSKSRQWLKSLLPLSTSTRTSTRRNLSSYPEEYHPLPAISFPPPRAVGPPRSQAPLDPPARSTLLRPGANLFHVPAFSGPFTIFGCALASEHRSRRAPVTRRYGFEPSVMDGSLSGPPRIVASTLRVCFSPPPTSVVVLFLSSSILCPARAKPLAFLPSEEDARLLLMGPRAGQSLGV